MRLLSVLAVVIMLSFSAFGAGFEKTAKVRSVEVVISSDKPLVVGTNTLRLHITDKGEAVEGNVEVKVFMPAMPGMPYMEATVDVKALGNGNYEGDVSLPMGGTWQIHIFVAPKNGKKYRIKSSVNI